MAHATQGPPIDEVPATCLSSSERVSHAIPVDEVIVTFSAGAAARAGGAGGAVGEAGGDLRLPLQQPRARVLDET